MLPGLINTSFRLGLALSAVTTALMLGTETIIQWTLSGKPLTIPEVTLNTSTQFLLVLLGVLITTRYWMPTILHKSGWHVTLHNQPANNGNAAMLAMSWGLIWRLTILLAPFEIVLVLLIWFFLPIGVVNSTVAGILFWVYIGLLYALTCALASAWLFRFPYGRHGVATKA
jgi:hypothetical protein